MSGVCDCLTSSCSRLAYIALPGCGRYCQCDIASGEWKQQTCNHLSNELFDETINTCNPMDSVEPDICASGEASGVILAALNRFIWGLIKKMCLFIYGFLPTYLLYSLSQLYRL